MERNLTIKKAAKEKGIRLWQIGEELGLTDDKFSRRLRHELPEDQREQILQIIDRLSKEDQ